MLGRCGTGFWGGCKPRYSRCPSVPHDGQVHTVHKSAARGFYPWGRYKLRGLCRRVVTSRRSAYDLPTTLSLLPPTHARSREHPRPRTPVPRNSCHLPSSLYICPCTDVVSSTIYVWFAHTAWMFVHIPQHADRSHHNCRSEFGP